jgi:hypothetical protein
MKLMLFFTTVFEPVARAACCLNGALRPSEQAGGFPEPRPFRFPPGGVLVWNANAENCNHLMQVSPRSGGHLKVIPPPGTLDGDPDVQPKRT